MLSACWPQCLFLIPLDREQRQVDGSSHCSLISRWYRHLCSLCLTLSCVNSTWYECIISKNLHIYIYAGTTYIFTLKSHEHIGLYWSPLLILLSENQILHRIFWYVQCLDFPLISILIVCCYSSRTETVLKIMALLKMGRVWSGSVLNKHHLLVSSDWLFPKFFHCFISEYLKTCRLIWPCSLQSP